jgi:hypothetical protein
MFVACTCRIVSRCVACPLVVHLTCLTTASNWQQNTVQGMDPLNFSGFPYPHWLLKPYHLHLGFNLSCKLRCLLLTSLALHCNKTCWMGLAHFLIHSPCKNAGATMPAIKSQLLHDHNTDVLNRNSEKFGGWGDREVHGRYLVLQEICWEKISYLTISVTFLEYFCSHALFILCTFQQS